MIKVNKRMITLVATCTTIYLGSPAQAQIPVGPAQLVNPNHSGFQQAPSVALAQDGSAVLVYAGDGHGNKRVRRLDPRGIPRGEERSLHLQPEEGFPLFQGLSASRKGQGAVCFGTGSPCICRLLNTRDFLGPIEIRCSDRELAALDAEQGPEVATFADGRFVVTWILSQIDPVTANANHQVFARFFRADGSPLGPSIFVTDDIENPPVSLSVAALAFGQAVVVWSGFGLDGDARGVRGRILSSDGQLLGSEFQVNTYTAGDQLRSRIASNLQDRFVVVWESVDQDLSSGGMFGQRFDRMGHRLGKEFQISGEAPSDQAFPSVAMDRSGRFSVAYYSFFEGGQSVEDIYFRSFDTDGNALGPPLPANEIDFLQQTFPSISHSDNGLIEVSYQSFQNTAHDPEYNFDILTRRFVLPCLDDAFTLCLKSGRFAVRAFWRDPAGQEELAKKISLVSDTGGFYFFDPTNFELLVKVLDGCAINQRFWVFAAGLTDVEVDLLITDTWTGQVETFHNQLGQAFNSVQEIGRLEGCSANQPIGQATAEKTAATPDLPGAQATDPIGRCTPSQTALCLNGGRYRVTARWSDFQGQIGAASTFPQSNDSGIFYFFESTNLELAVKVLDGCAINSHHWVFAAGLTNVEVTLTVEEMTTGTIWQRHNDLGAAFPPILDTGAFACATP